jgi:hypothetical protein
MESITLVTILFIVVVFIPGHFFKRFYFSGKFTRQFTAGDFAERVVTSLFWGVIIQLITFYVFSRFIEIDLDNIGKVCTMQIDKITKNDFTSINSIEFRYCFLYISISILTAIALGYIFHKIVRLLKLDVRVKAIRFANEWHYLFTGHNLKSNERQMGKGKVEAVVLDIVSENGDGGTILYSGLLNSYSLNGNGELETISITESERYSKSNGGFVPILGDCLVLPYSRILNINLRYVVKKRIPKTFTGQFAAIKNISLTLFFISIIAIPVLIIFQFSKLGFLMCLLSVAVAEVWILFFGAAVAMFFDKKIESKAVKVVGLLIIFSIIIAMTLLLNFLLSR